MKSTFSGVSTFTGTLKVGNLESTGGTFNGTYVNATNGSFGTLEAVNWLYAKAGIITDMHCTVGVVTNGLYADIGITTLSHVTTEYVTTSNIYTGIATNLTVSNTATVANANITNGTITNLVVPATGDADIEIGNIKTLTSEDITFTDDLIGPDAYFSNDVDSDGMTTRYLGSKYGVTPGNNAHQLTICANSGIYTCIVGYAATLERINMVSGGDGLCAPKVYANTGIITALNAGATGSMTIDAGSAGQIKSFQFESTATTVPPIKTSSTAKCINLNADLLDGLTMKDNNWTSGASIMGRDSNGDVKARNFNGTLFQGGTGAFPTGLSAGTSTLGATSVTSLTVSGSFSATGTLQGNALTATTSTNVKGTANRVIYNSSTDVTTTSSNLQFNGTTMTVQNLTVNGSLSANLSSATAGTANNVTGAGGRVLYNSSTNNTSTSSNLTFNGTNLTCGGNITAYSSMVLKDNVTTITDALSKVLNLRGVEFDYKESGQHNIGLVAEEVEKVLPDLVHDNDNGIKSLAYSNIVAVLVEAVKDLKKEIDVLKSDKVDKIYKPSK